jgi:hypothetical protein
MESTMEIKTSIQAETFDNLQAFDRSVEDRGIVEPTNVFRGIHFDTSQPLCFPCFAVYLSELHCCFRRRKTHAAVSMSAGLSPPIQQ